MGARQFFAYCGVAALMPLGSTHAAKPTLVVVDVSAPCESVLAVRGRLELLGAHFIEATRSPADDLEHFRATHHADLALGSSVTPPVPDVEVPATASTAISLACRGQLDDALDAAGSAVEPAVFLAPKGDASLPRGPLLARWAKARAKQLQGQDARAALREILDALESGETAPVARAPRGPTVDAIAPFANSLVLFSARDVSIMDPRSGAIRARLEIGPLLPALTIVPSGRAVIAAKGLVALDPSASPRTTFQIPLESAWPELASNATTSFAAGASDVLAFDPFTGDVRWRRDLFKEIGSGPVWFMNRIAVPTENEVILLDAETGETRDEVELPDEVASPLLAASGALYLLLGSDKLARIAPGDAPAAVLLARGLFGSSFPPVIVGDSAWIGVKERRRGQGIVRVQLALDRPDDPPSPKAEVGRAPIVALPVDGLAHVGPSGDTVVRRNALGKELWRASVGGPISELTVTSHEIWARTEHRLISLDQANGKKMSELRFEAPIVATSIGDAEGAVALANGQVYTLPGRDDSRVGSWLRIARIQLARAYADKGDRAKAKAAFEAVLARSDDDPDALMGLAELSGKKEAAKWLTRLLAAISEHDPYAAIAQRALARP